MEKIIREHKRLGTGTLFGVFIFVLIIFFAICFKGSINKTIRNLNKKPEKRVSLDNEFRNKLYRKFKPEIENLSNITRT